MLRTSEFMPYVVFIAAPELETLRAMHKAVVDAGITTKLLTVSSSFQANNTIFLLKFFLFLLGMFNSIHIYEINTLYKVLENKNLFPRCS